MQPLCICICQMLVITDAVPVIRCKLVWQINLTDRESGKGNASISSSGIIITVRNASNTEDAVMRRWCITSNPGRTTRSWLSSTAI